MVFLMPLIAGAQINLGSFQNISDTPGTPSDEQNFINVENNYYTVWNKWGDIAFSKSDDAGENWGDALTVYSASDYSANYPVLAASGDDVMIFYYRNTSGSNQVFMVKSDDGGASFGAETVISSSVNGAQVPQVVAEEGVVYLVYEDRDENYDYQVAFQKSTDLGDTWSEPVMLTGSEEASRWCNIDVEGGSVYVTYNEQTGDEYDHLDIFFTKSDDGGDNWTAPENISNNQDYNARLSTKVMDDMVYVASSSNVDGIQSDIRLYRSDDLGQSWLEPVRITNNSGNNARPDLWLGRNAENDHRIYIIYSDGTYTGYDNAYLKYSLDHGQNWSDKVQISQDTEDGSWPQIGGTPGSSADELYFVWNRPEEGTFDYEIWGRSGFNEFTALAEITGVVTNLSDDPVQGALVTVGTYTTTTDASGNFAIDIPGGTYSLSVEAEGYNTYYEEITVEGGESYAFEIQLSPFEPVMFPPLNLDYTIIGSDVELDWDAPATEGMEMRYDNGGNADEVGGEPEHFEAAIRFTPSDLQPYAGQYLTEINFFNTDKNCQVFARVWQGGNQNYPGELVFEQEVTELNENAWNRVELDQPLLIDDSQELWMGYKVLNPEGVYPAGTDNGPAVPFKGDMILYYSDWVGMSDYFGWNINWNIYGLAVSTETPVRNVLSKVSPRAANVDGYNIYKNEEYLDNVPSLQTNYTYEGIGMGIHTFYVTSTYEEWESNPSNTVEMVVTSNDNHKMKDITVGPVPASEVLNIVFNDSKVSRVRLLDISGRVIIEKQIDYSTRNIELNLPEQLNGVYIIDIEGEKDSLTRKVIIE